MMRQEADHERWAILLRRWADEDPDPVTARLTREIIESGDRAALGDCVEPALEFGTAGLRGVVGPGPARMNLAVIRRVTRALAEVVQRRASQAGDGARSSTAPIVVGFDGRVDSRRFAREVVGVLAETKVPVVHFDRPVPTPVAVYAAQRLAASATVVVTASHNPPEYNGYKVYGADAIQIVPPFDSEVSAEMQRLGAAREIAVCAEAFEHGTAQAVALDDSVGDGYIEAVLAGRAAGAKALPIRIAYTPLHGVGAAWVERAFRAAGYADLRVEPSQREIDGLFPTVRFPNPEEPATLLLGLRLASDMDADVLLVNDPDADRMGAALRARDGTFRVLTGNEIGIILTDYLLAHAREPTLAAVTSTIVSTPMVARVTAQHGAHLETTLTGFKWLWTAMRVLEREGQKHFALCWEEALGYSTHAAVRDKDGIAAALVFADWISECRAGGITPIERLSDLYRRHGAWASVQHSVVRPRASGVEEIRRMMTHLGQDPPRELAGRKVTFLDDYSQGAPMRPTWRGAASMFVIELEGGARIVVRPSGTEPKLKCYADVEEAVRVGEDPLAAHERARTIAEALNQALVRWLEMVALRSS
jgi:phosphomannomutase